MSSICFLMQNFSVCQSLLLKTGCDGLQIDDIHGTEGGNALNGFMDGRHPFDGNRVGTPQADIDVGRFMSRAFGLGTEQNNLPMGLG